MFRQPSGPKNLVNKYRALLDANLRQAKPAWYVALKDAPSPPSLVREPSYFNTRGQLKFEQPGEGGNGAPTTGKTLNYTRSAHSKKRLTTKPPRPPKIVYPEDSLRRQFYRDHPHELNRPTTLLEISNNEGLDWDDALSNYEVTGERVIQYQLYLMKKEGKSRSEAYKIALTKFYERRAAEELEQHIAAQEALSYGAVPFHKPQVDETLRYEKKMLKESEGIITRRAELRQSGAAATEKSFTVVTPTA